MRCAHCSSLMSEVETLVDGRTEQTQLECSFCGISQLLTRRLDLANHSTDSISDGLQQRNNNLLEKYLL